jgi:hypothetical protein
MSPSRTLAEIAHTLDELLLRPGYLAAARHLAEACLADPEQAHVDALQFPNDANDPDDWTDESVQRERGLEATPVLTPCQRALALAALHAVYCRGFETVLAIPTEVAVFDAEGRITDEYRRASRWAVITDRVRQLGDYAANWFDRLLRRFALDLPSCRTPAEMPATQRCALSSPSAAISEDATQGSLTRVQVPAVSPFVEDPASQVQAMPAAASDTRSLPDAEDNPEPGCSKLGEFEGHPVRVTNQVLDVRIIHDGASGRQHQDELPAGSKREATDDAAGATGQGGAIKRNDEPRTTKRPKKSTERGEARRKIIAVLTKHHRYADGSCLNFEPIGNNDLARKAGVEESTASAFFKKEFKGHSEYRAACLRNDSGLVTVLMLLNDEFPAHLVLYGSTPPGEGPTHDD